MNRWIHSSGITLWPLTCEVKILIFATINRWNISGSKWTFSPQGSCVRSRKKRGSVRIWLSLIRAKVGWLDDGVRASPSVTAVWWVMFCWENVSLCGYSLMAEVSFSRIMHAATNQKRFRNGLRFTTMILRRSLGLQIPRSQFSRASVKRVGQKRQIYGDPSSQLTGIEGSNMLVADSTAHHQESGVVHASAWSQGCFGSWRRTNTMLRRWL